MKQAASAFVAGLLFAVGLVLAGMTQPAKVVAFLDFFGAWDPSLAVVMGTAVVVHFALYRLVLKRPSPLLGGSFSIPSRRDLTPQLIGGSILFGIGWGLGGYCPGPGLVSAPSGGAGALTFAATMTIGMWLYQALESMRSRDSARGTADGSTPPNERTPSRRSAERQQKL